MSDTPKADMAIRKIGAAAARWKNGAITAMAFSHALDRFADVVAELERENGDLRQWIREEGDRNYTCTYFILGKEICQGCNCKRAKRKEES